MSGVALQSITDETVVLTSEIDDDVDKEDDEDDVDDVDEEDEEEVREEEDNDEEVDILLKNVDIRGK